MGRDGPATPDEEIEQTSNELDYLRRLTDWCSTATLNISACSTEDACHLLLCAKDLGVMSHGLRGRLALVCSENDPPERQREHIVQSLLRQVVLMRYDAAPERRELLTELARAAAEATVELVRRKAGLDLRPGLVVSVATAGDLLQWHPHVHLLTSDGGFAADGRFVPVAPWDATLLDRHAISQDLVQKLLSWRHPGFSAHVGEPIDPHDKQRVEDTAAYLVRNPLSLRKANRVRGARQPDEAEPQGASAEAPRRRSSPSWARLIAKVHQVDPLVCTRCGQKMKTIGFLTDQLSIRRILDHLGLSTPPHDKPPPVREILRVAEQGEGWGVPADW